MQQCVFYSNGKCNNPNCAACNCCNNVDCYYKQLQQLKAKNENLKQECDLYKTWYRVNQLCLYEIEEICTHETINLTDSCINGGRYIEILQLIKQAKEGGE